MAACRADSIQIYVVSVIMEMLMVVAATVGHRYNVEWRLYREEDFSDIVRPHENGNEGL